MCICATVVWLCEKRTIKMKLSSKKKEDCELFSFLLKLPLKERTRFIHKYVAPNLQHRMTEHVARLVWNPPPYIRDSAEYCEKIHKTLHPHKELINAFINKARRRKNLKKPYKLTGQKGGAIFSLIIGGLLPLLADIIIRSVSK